MNAKLSCFSRTDTSDPRFAGGEASRLMQTVLVFSAVAFPHAGKVQQVPSPASPRRVVACFCSIEFVRCVLVFESHRTTCRKSSREFKEEGREER